MRTSLLIIFLWFPAFCFCQKVEVSLSKNPVARNEQFQVTFSLNAKADSVKQPNLSAFKIITGPTRGFLSTIANGVQANRESYTYTLESKSPGNFKLLSTTFYLRGNAIFEAFEVAVKEEILTDQELEEISKEKAEIAKREAFKKQVLKENGTVQILFKGDMGYVKIWKDGKEQNYKDLSKAEIELLKKQLKIAE